MKKTDIIKLDKILNDFPESLGKLIKESFESKNYRKKIDARNTLVKKDKTIVPPMHKLLESESNLIRRKAIKIVELFADRRSIPVFINLLDDDEFEIRWIAAEGLVRIGRYSILPLLESVRYGDSSFIHNKAVYHALLGLLNEKEKENLLSLFHSLDDYHELGETAPVEASQAIKAIYKRKSRVKPS